MDPVNGWDPFGLQDRNDPIAIAAAREVQNVNRRVGIVAPFIDYAVMNVTWVIVDQASIAGSRAKYDPVNNVIQITRETAELILMAGPAFREMTSDTIGTEASDSNPFWLDPNNIDLAGAGDWQLPSGKSFYDAMGDVAHEVFHAWLENLRKVNGSQAQQLYFSALNDAVNSRIPLDFDLESARGERAFSDDDLWRVVHEALAGYIEQRYTMEFRTYALSTQSVDVDDLNVKRGNRYGEIIGNARYEGW